MIIKVANIGKHCIGKTSLFHAIVEDKKFSDDYNMSIGAELLVKNIKKDNLDLNLYLWDMAGQHKFQFLVNSYIEGVKVILFCYSSNDYDSYKDMIERHDYYKENKKLENKHIVITMTKADIPKKFDNAEYLGLKFSNRYGYKFISTSASTKEGIDDLIEELINIEPNEEDRHTLSCEQIMKKFPIHKKISCIIF